MAWLQRGLTPFLILLIGVWAGEAVAQEVRDRTDILRQLAPRADDAGFGAERPSIDLQVQFALGSANLTAAAKEQLDALAEAMASEALADQRFLVAGHTDATGSEELNLDLSFRRARSARAYLVDLHEIAPARLAIVGYGESRLKNPLNPSGAENRRVEVVVLGALLR